MKDLTEKPEVGIEVDRNTGEFTILTGDELIVKRYMKWKEYGYNGQFWDRRFA